MPSLRAYFKYSKIEQSQYNVRVFSQLSMKAISILRVVPDLIMHDISECDGFQTNSLIQKYALVKLVDLNNLECITYRVNVGIRQHVVKLSLKQFYVQQYYTSPSQYQTTDIRAKNSGLSHHFDLKDPCNRYQQPHRYNSR